MFLNEKEMLILLPFLLIIFVFYFIPDACCQNSTYLKEGIYQYRQKNYKETYERDLFTAGIEIRF
jgi:hypothetical protein